jgi:hypothetical protein
LILLALILLILGVITAVFPYAGWYLSIGWQFKDAEPSDLALGMQRIAGIIFSIIGLVLIISSCSDLISKNTWPRDFKEKLSAGHVKSIYLDLEGAPLSEEQKNDILSLIRNAEMRYVEDKSYSSTYNTSLEITFTDGSRETIEDHGTHFQIRPNGVKDTKYLFNSDDLENWIREHEGQPKIIGGTEIKTVTKEQLKKVTPKLTYEEVVEILGHGKDIGSGLIILEYKYNGQQFTLNFTSYEGLITEDDYKEIQNLIAE